MRKKQSYQSASKLQLIHPRYWFTWLSLGVLYLFVQLPYRGQLMLGRKLGQLAYYLIPKRRKIAAKNLELCFPELTDIQRKVLLKKHFIELGISVFETGMGWWWPEKKLQQLAHFSGLEYVDAAIKQGYGILILGPHCTTMDLVGRFISFTFPMHAVYREQKNAVIDFLLRKRRQQSLMKLIHRHDLRGVIKALKNKQAVWYAPDQDYGRKHSIFVPFFDVTASTITMPSRYAKLTNAAALIITYYRKTDNSGYAIQLSPSLENFPSNNDAADAARINHLFEIAIRNHPAQYLWIHRRFKTRPQGEKRFY